VEQAEKLSWVFLHSYTIFNSVICLGRAALSEILTMIWGGGGGGWLVCFGVVKFGA
jgi:hypothetical protein